MTFWRLPSGVELTRQACSCRSLSYQRACEGVCLCQQDSRWVCGRVHWSFLSFWILYCTRCLSFPRAVHVVPHCYWRNRVKRGQQEERNTSHLDKKLLNFVRKLCWPQQDGGEAWWSPLWLRGRSSTQAGIKMIQLVACLGTAFLYFMCIIYQLWVCRNANALLIVRCVSMFTCGCCHCSAFNSLSDKVIACHHVLSLISVSISCTKEGLVTIRCPVSRSV